MKGIVDFNNPQFTIMGRALKINQGIAFSYPGVSVSFNAETKSLELVAYCLVGKGRLDVLINGKTAKTLLISKTPKTFRLFSSKYVKNKKIELVNRGESWHGVIVLSSINLEDGILLSAPKLSAKKLAFIGDSITSGALMERNPNSNKGPHLSNAYQSFGMQIGRLLDTQVHLIGFGGRGLIQDYNGLQTEPQLPDIFKFTIPVPSFNQLWPPNTYIPDGIFICLGTNDFHVKTPNLDDFTGNYRLFIEKLLTLYPDTQILISDGPMLNDSAQKKANKLILQRCLEDIVKVLNHPQVNYIKSIDCHGDDFDPHPTVDQQTQLAEHFAPIIQEKLAWN